MSIAAEKQYLTKPFLKWAGGKGRLIPEIDARLPIGLKTGQIDTYVEPFVGGGAVFFHIAQNYNSVSNFYLFDINQDLVNCYNAVKNDVELLICELGRLEKKFIPLDKPQRKEMFLQIRKKFNTEKQKNPTVKTSAKLIFLNKTCFNGLYRVNRKGEFNVPFGDYKKPTICNGGNLRPISKILQRAKIICGDFTKSKRYIKNNTFVYFDPPYRPLSATASFTSYSKDCFSEDDQKRLAEFCSLVKQKGAEFLLSNSDPKNEDPTDHFFEEHYKKNNGFTIKTVKASRMINCKAAGRGQINELIIINY